MAFNQGEEVLVYYQDILYDAKIRRAKLICEDVWRYCVHYVGWNNSYDEWVDEDRILHKTKENLRLQTKNYNAAGKISEKPQQTHQHFSNSSKNDVRASVEESQNNLQSKPAEKLIATRPPAAAASEHIMESQPPKEAGGPSEYVSVQVLIPRRLRTKLLEHRDLVRAGKLTKLPRKPNVGDVLEMYPEHRRGEEICAMEISSRLRYYFNTLLEPILLYGEERSQYEEAMAEKSLEPSEVYGAEHLLRLFVKLPMPELLQTSDYTEDELTQLEDELQLFLKFLEDRGSEIFE